MWTETRFRFVTSGVSSDGGGTFLSFFFFCDWISFSFWNTRNKILKKAKLRYCSLEMNKWAKYNIYSSFSVIE